MITTALRMVALFVAALCLVWQIKRHQRNGRGPKRWYSKAAVYFLSFFLWYFLSDFGIVFVWSAFGGAR